MAARSNNYFDRARASSALFLAIGGAIAIVGSVLDWVTVQPPALIPEEQAHRLATFNGIEAGDGKVVIGAGVVLLLSAGLLVWRKKSLYAWIAFLASMVIGGIAIADFRGINRLFYEEMNRIGAPSPAFGLMLVAISAVVGLLASLAGIAASPHEQQDLSTSG